MSLTLTLTSTDSSSHFSYLPCILKLFYFLLLEIAAREVLWAPETGSDSLLPSSPRVVSEFCFTYATILLLVLAGFSSTFDFSKL